MIIGRGLMPPEILPEVDTSPEERAKNLLDMELHRKNLRCYERNSQWLREQHSGEFVIVAGEEVFVGPNTMQVYAEAEAKYPHEKQAFFTIHLSIHRGPNISANRR